MLNASLRSRAVVVGGPHSTDHDEISSVTTEGHKHRVATDATARHYEYDFFVNHCQESGQDQARSLAQSLRQKGFKVWLDMEVSDITRVGMEACVRDSRCFVIFLSDGAMARPFCNDEQRWAKKYGCTVVGVVEKDSRYNPADRKGALP